MKPHRLRLLPGFLLLALLSCSRPDRDRGVETARVLEVIDGDTIVLTDGREVRYMCIDAPERGERLYDEARQVNFELVAGKTITLRYGRRRTDRYGRTLAVVEVNHVAVADSLIAAGVAMVYGFPENADFLAPLIPLQRRAIDRRIGLWSELPLDDEDYYIASVTAYRFHRPSCRFAAQIAGDRRREYDSKIDAYYDGLSPCGECRP